MRRRRRKRRGGGEGEEEVGGKGEEEDEKGIYRLRIHFQKGNHMLLTHDWMGSGGKACCGRRSVCGKCGGSLLNHRSKCQICVINEIHLYPGTYHYLYHYYNLGSIFNNGNLLLKNDYLLLFIIYSCQ